MQELLALVEGSENLAAKVHQSLVEDQPQKFLAHPALLVAKGHAVDRAGVATGAARGASYSGCGSSQEKQVLSKNESQKHY